MNIPENFKSTIIDFVKGLSVTFPEYVHLWEKWSNNEENSENEYKSLFEYFLTVYPERFFDIIYQNNDIFLKDSVINTYFLPGVDFKVLYNCEGLSENSKKTIWKYLQLILLTISSSIKDKSDFGDTAKLFDCIDENELQSKLKDTMDGISDFFSKMGVDVDNMDENSEIPKTENGTDEETKSNHFTFNNPNGPNLPNLEELHEQLKGLFDGKIGNLAKELAEEISGEFSNILGESSNDVKSTNDVFKKIMKNPKKMMDLVKTIGDKIKFKMDSGEISREELMKEATEIMQKMKGMGNGTGEGENNQFNDILKNLTKGMGGDGKMNDIFKHLAKSMAKGSVPNPNDIFKNIAKDQNKVENKKKTNTNFILEKSDATKNNYVFKLPDEEPQNRSNAPPAFTDEQLIAEFEKDQKKMNNSNNSNNSNNPKKKQNKKKKGK